MRILSAATTLLLLITVSGCATLPNVEKVFDQLPESDGPPLIVGAQHPLSPEERRAALKQLKEQSGPTDILERHIKVMELISGRPLISGNRAILLKNGPAIFASKMEAILTAKDQINLETFIFKNDRIGLEFTDILSKKQTEGIQVNILYDDLGSFKTPSSFFQQLREAGGSTLEFNPISLRNVLKIFHRDHRKILVVDGAIAFAGGSNIVDIYARPSFALGIRKGSPAEWRDTDVRIEGPAAAEFQKLFLDTWRAQGGPELDTARYFSPAQPKGNALVRVIGSSPGREGYGAAYLFYISAIEHATAAIHITNSYFVPDKQMLTALMNASKRGVDVRIIVPGITDHMIAVYAGRYYYTGLLKAGVKIYERQKMILHAKTAVIDKVWSTVGSTNLDYLSFTRTDEVNAVILCREFGAEMEEMFRDDLMDSTQVLLEEWKKRPLLPRFIEWFSNLFRHWL